VSVIDTLITDRTNADVTEYMTLRAKGYFGMTTAEKALWDEGHKGAYNATDLNRVGEAIEYLEAQFNDLPGELSTYIAALGVVPDSLFEVSYSYPISAVTAKTDWVITDIPTQTQIATYISNINTIRAVILLADGTPDTPADMEKLTYTEANNIETILQAVDVATLALEALKKSYADYAAKSWWYCGEAYCGGN